MEDNRSFKLEDNRSFKLEDNQYLKAETNILPFRFDNSRQDEINQLANDMLLVETRWQECYTGGFVIGDCIFIVTKQEWLGFAEFLLGDDILYYTGTIEDQQFKVDLNELYRTARVSSHIPSQLLHYFYANPCGPAFKYLRKTVQLARNAKYQPLVNFDKFVLACRLQVLKNIEGLKVEMSMIKGKSPVDITRYDFYHYWKFPTSSEDAKTCYDYNLSLLKDLQDTEEEIYHALLRAKKIFIGLDFHGLELELTFADDLCLFDPHINVVVKDVRSSKTNIGNPGQTNSMDVGQTNNRVNKSENNLSDVPQLFFTIAENLKQDAREHSDYESSSEEDSVEEVIIAPEQHAPDKINVNREWDFYFLRVGDKATLPLDKFIAMQDLIGPDNYDIYLRSWFHPKNPADRYVGKHIIPYTQAELKSQRIKDLVINLPDRYVTTEQNTSNLGSGCYYILTESYQDLPLHINQLKGSDAEFIFYMNEYYGVLLDRSKYSLYRGDKYKNCYWCSLDSLISCHYLTDTNCPDFGRCLNYDSKELIANKHKTRHNGHVCGDCDDHDLYIITFDKLNDLKY